MRVLSFKEKGLTSHNWLSMKWVVSEMWSHQRSSSRIWNQLKVMLSHSPCGWRFFRPVFSLEGQGKWEQSLPMKRGVGKRNFYSHLKNRTWRLIDNRQKGRSLSACHALSRQPVLAELPCPMCQSLFPSFERPCQTPSHPLTSSCRASYWLHPCGALHRTSSCVHLLCCPWELAHFAFLTVSLGASTGSRRLHWPLNGPSTSSFHCSNLLCRIFFWRQPQFSCS